jgi:cytochrome b561
MSDTLVPAGAGRARYSIPAQALHWVMALLILGAWIIPSLVEDLPKPERAQWIGLHKSIGITVLALLVLRAVWRLVSPPPDLPAGTAPWIRHGAVAGHAVLYALMLGLPLVGVLMSGAAGRPVMFFGLFTLPALIGPDPALAKTLKGVHEILANGILALVGLHVAAALFHQYVLKDGTLARMTPGRA